MNVPPWDALSGDTILFTGISCEDTQLSWNNSSSDGLNENILPVLSWTTDSIGDRFLRFSFSCVSSFYLSPLFVFSFFPFQPFFLFPFPLLLHLHRSLDRPIDR